MTERKGVAGGQDTASWQAQLLTDGLLTGVGLIAVLALPVPCDEMSGNVFRRFRGVVLGSVTIPPYHITYVGTGAYVTHYTSNSVFWIGAVGLVVVCWFHDSFITRRSQVSVRSARHKSCGLLRCHTFGIVAFLLAWLVV